MKGQRLDRAGLAAPKSATIFEGRAARTHDRRTPLRYRNTDGTERLEYRDAAELKKLADRMVGIPVTLGHYGKKVGSVVSARVDSDHVVVQLAVTDEVAARAVRTGTAAELSLGYQCDADDGWQRNIDPFELALVSKARCGATCAVRADRNEDENPREPSFSVGDRVVATVGHGVGLSGRPCIVVTAISGSPPQYGVRFDDQLDWSFSEEEIRGAL